MSYKIVVTGASSGIGRASVLELVKSGHEVLALARRKPELESLQKEVQAIIGESKKGFPLKIATVDLTSSASIDELFKTQENFLSQTQVLLNNAGLALGREPFQESQIEDIEKMISTNVTALLKLTRKILPSMMGKNFGHIVNLGSIAGIQSYLSGTVYCATKAAVHMITDCLRLDLAGSGIRVSTIAPGRVAETEFSMVRFKGDEARAKSVYEGFRVMTAEDVARTIAWVINQPPHINIQEIVLMSTDQPDARSVVPLKN